MHLHMHMQCYAVLCSDGDEDGDDATVIKNRPAAAQCSEDSYQQISPHQSSCNQLLWPEGTS